MSNLTDFFPSGGGGLTPKFQEFNASGTFTPTQALIDAGGYIEVFLVGGGGSAGANSNYGGAGGEVIIKKYYLTNTNTCTVTIAASANNAEGNNSVFDCSNAGGNVLTALGGAINGDQSSKMGAGWGSRSLNAYMGAAGSGVLGYGAGGTASNYTIAGIVTGKANSGQGAQRNVNSGSGYCLIKWYE